MTSTETRIKIRTLATSTTDPQRSGEIMLEAAKQSVKMTKRVLALNFVKGCRRRRVGTQAVEKMAKILLKLIKLIDLFLLMIEKRLIIMNIRLIDLRLFFW